MFYKDRCRLIKMSKIFKKVLTFVLVVILGFSEINIVYSARKLKPKSKKGTKRRSNSSSKKRRRAGNRRRNQGGTGLSGKLSNSDNPTDPKIPKIFSVCQKSYVACMDAQIPYILENYAYLNEDAGVENLLELKDQPLRCIYYHDTKTGKDISNNVSSVDRGDTSTKKLKSKYRVKMLY